MILLTAGIEADTMEEIASEYPVVLACEYLEGVNFPTVSIDLMTKQEMKKTQFILENMLVLRDPCYKCSR